MAHKLHPTLAMVLITRKRRCKKCGRKNAKHNGEKWPLCGHCFKPWNLQNAH